MRHPLLSPVVLALALTACNSTKNFLSDTVAPPFAKLVSTALTPVAGRDTTRKFEQALKEGRLGSFSGEPQVVPVAPNLFWFYQPADKSQRFRFTTSQHSPYGEGKWVIEPESMFFDGSSVPRGFWAAKSFGPFDFTKAAIIHDWLFEAHHRSEIFKWASSHSEDKEWERRSHQWSVYSEEPDKDATDMEGRPRPTERGLTMPIAADIMAECMYREMETSRRSADYVRGSIAQQEAQARKAKELGQQTSLTGDTVRGLNNILESLDIASPRPQVLGIYHWSINSPFSRSVWNPEDRKALLKEHSRHASSAATIQALLDNPMHSQAVADGLVTPWLAGQFRSLNGDAAQAMAVVKASAHTTQRAAAIVQAMPAGATLEPSRRVVINATVPVQFGEGPVMLEALFGSDASRAESAVAQVRRQPSSIEVRYYRYPEDREGAERILAILNRAGLTGGRVSYVIDKGETRDPGTSRFQVAFTAAAVQAWQSTRKP